MSLETKVQEAIRLHQIGKIGVAKKRYEQILKVNPNHFDALHMLGVAHFDQGNYQSATKLITQAVQIYQGSAIAYFNLANAWLAQGDMDKASDAYLKAIALDPYYPDANLNLGVLYRTLGRINDARYHLEQALTCRPQCAKSKYQLGLIHTERDDVTEAEACFRAALADKADFPEALTHLGNLLANQNKLAEAISCFEEAIRHDPSLWEAQKSLGAALAERGLLSEAEACLRMAESLNPESQAIKSHQAVLMRLRGNLNLAFESCLEILDQLPNDTSTLALAGQISTEIGDLVAALRFYEKNYRMSEKHKWREECGAFAAVCHYLQDDLEAVSSIVYSLQSRFSTNMPHLKVAAAYSGFLGLLLENQTPPLILPSAPRLYVLAESHGLSHHGNVVSLAGITYQCKALWIPGCKQWHLASQEQNNYKTAVQIQLSKLSRGSLVLVAFGEIDCRLDTGIIPYIQKHPEKVLEDVITSTVAGYLRFVQDLNTESHHRVIIQGVPAPNLDRSSADPEEARLLSLVIREVNHALRKACGETGFGFLDVYSMTNSANGFADGSCHIDRFHLTPSACAQAFDKFLVWPRTI